MSVNLDTNIISILSNASDASFYRIVPKSISYPKNINDIVGLIQWCRINNDHLTFRASGTSLSGQALGSGIIASISGNWNQLEVMEKGKKVFVESGVIGSKINNKLKKYGRSIGPDPASINACSVGGILANNSSGMRSGINRNAYNTCFSLKYVLPNSLILDSSEREINFRLLKHSPNIFNGLIDIRERIRCDDYTINKITG